MGFYTNHVKKVRRICVVFTFKLIEFHSLDIAKTFLFVF